MIMDKDYDAVQAKFCASLLWFVCRVREDGSCDVIPQVTSPMQLVKGRVVVKAAVVEYLTSAQMYAAVVSTILQCRVSTVWDLLPTLAEHRVHVTDNDEPVLESDIMERKPFKMSTHLAVMDAIMEMYANKLVNIQKILSTVRSIFPFDTHSRDSPFDLEDALLQWMNKVNEANNMERAQHTKQVFPQMSDVHECLQDGISLLSLLLYYTSDVVHIDEMKLAKRLVASEREHNIELFRRLCAQFVTTSVFALRIEDFANAHQFLKTNFVCLLAEIFHKLTRVKQPQQQLDEEANLPRVMEDNFVKEQPSSIHQQPLLDRRQKMNTSTVPVYQTSGGSRNERPPPLHNVPNTQGASMQRNINTTLLGYKDGVKLVEEALHNRGVRKAEEALHNKGVRKAEEEPIPYTPCISRPSSSKKENSPPEETNSNQKTYQPPEDNYESVKIPNKASHIDNNYATSSAGNNHLDSWDFEADVRKEPPAVVARYESTEDDDDVLSTITEGTEPEAPSLYSFHSDDTMHDSSIEEGLIGDDIYYADDKPSIEQTGDEELDSTLLGEEEADSQILVEKPPAKNALSSQPLIVGVSYIINETSVETALASGIPVIEGSSNDDNSSPSVSKTFSQSDKSANRNYLASSQADDPLTSSSQDKQRQQQTALQEKQRQQQTALQEKQRQQQKVKKDNEYDDFDVKSSYVLQSWEIDQSSNAEEGQKKHPEKVVNSLSSEPLTTSNTKKEDLPESTNEQPLTIPYQKSENRSANEQQPIEKKTKTEEPPKKLADDNIFDIEEFIRQNKRFPSEREMFPPGRRKGWPFTQMGNIKPPVIHLNWGELSRKPGKKTWAELVGGKPRQPLGDLEKQKEKCMELLNTKKSGEGKKMCWIDEVNKKKKSQDISEATEEHAWYTSPKYAAVRLQLQEQRRRYAEKKKNEEQQWREERAKGLQDAFVMMVLNQGKENEDPSSYEFDQPPAEQKEQSPIAEERSPGLWFVGIPDSRENINTASDSKPPEEILPETEKVRELVHTEQQMSSHQPAVEPQKSNFSPPKSNFSPQSASSNRIPPSHSQPGFTKPEKYSSEHLPSTNQQATTYPAPSFTYPPSQPTDRLPINQLHHFSVNPSAQPLVDQQFTQPLVDQQFTQPLVEQQFTKDQSTDQTNRTFSQESSGHQNQTSFVPSLTEQPSSQPDHSSSRPNHPSSRPDQPSSRLVQPSSQRDNPSSRPDHSSSRPDNPSGRPDHPSSQPDNPTSRLGVENEAVDEPKKSSLQKLKELSNSTSINPTEHPTNATVTIESNRQQQIHEHNANSTYTQQHQQSLQEQQQQIQDDHWQQQQHQQHQEKQQYNQQQQQIQDDHWQQQQHQEKQQYNQQQQQIQDDHWQQQQHQQHQEKQQYNQQQQQIKDDHRQQQQHQEKQQYNQQQQQIQDDHWQQQQHQEKQQYNQQQQQYQQHQGQQQGQHSFYQQQNQTYLLKTQIKDHMGYNNLQPVIEQKNQNIGQQNLNQQHFEQTNGQHFEQQNKHVPNQHKTFTVPPQHQEQHFQQFDQQHSQQINQQKHQPQQHFERQEQQPQQINQQSQHVDERQQINKQTQQLNDQYQSQQHQRQQITEQNSNQSQHSQQQQQTQQHQSQQINDHQQTLQQQQSTFLVTPQKVDQKSCTFTLTDNDVPTEMTPDQLKKKERFLKNRQKRQEQERLKKEKKAREEELLLEAKQLEEERRTEETVLKEQRERRRKEQLEEERVREETERLKNEMMNKRVHGITYSTMQRRQDSSEDLRSNSASRATRISSSNSSENVRKPPRQQSAPPPLSSQLPKDNPPTHSVYSEYKGPVVYTKPSGKSNRKIIQNAIAHCCLCGEVNREAKNKCLEALSLSEGSHFLVLFREGLKFRSVYDYNPDTQVVTRIYGIGPKSITPKMITKYFKYNSGGKAFNSLDTLHLSIQVDGVMIKKEMWEGRKAKPAKK